MYTCSFFLQDMITDCYHFFLGIRSFHLWTVDRVTYGVIETVHDARSLGWTSIYLIMTSLARGEVHGPGCVYFSWRTSFAYAKKTLQGLFFTSKIIHSINPSECQVKDVLQEAEKRDDLFRFWHVLNTTTIKKKNTRNRGKKWASETCKLSDFRSKKANCGLQVRSTRPCLPWFLAQPWMNLQNPWRSCTYSNVVYMDDDWCWQTYLQIPRFAWPFLKACILWVVLNCETCTRCAGWHTILYISLVTKIALLAISTLETWVLWMTLAVASLNCCWMTLNDSTWGGP